MKPLLPLLRHPPRNVTLEAYLAELQSDARPQRQEQLTAIRYYLQCAIAACEQGWQANICHGTTNQLGLLEQIEEWRYGRREVVWLATFNYDTMLEAALDSYLSKRIDTLASYVASDHYYRLVKLHGSIHWYRELDEGPQHLTGIDPTAGADVIAKAAGTLRLSDRFYCGSRHDVIAQAGLTFGAANQTLYPAVAIPVEGKSDFECPSDHLAALSNALPAVDKLIVIGWHGAEDHFLKLLRERISGPVNGLVVDRDREHANDVAQRLTGVLPMGSFLRPSKFGFTRALREEQFRDFLIATPA